MTERKYMDVEDLDVYTSWEDKPGVHRTVRLRSLQRRMMTVMSETVTVHGFLVSGVRCQEGVDEFCPSDWPIPAET